MSLSFSKSCLPACQVLLLLLTAWPASTAFPSRSEAEEPQAANHSLTELAEAMAAAPDLQEQLKAEVAAGEFSKAGRTAQQRYNLRAGLADADPAALFYVASEAIDCMLAGEELQQAAQFSKQVQAKLQQRQAPAELLAAIRDTHEAIEQLQAQHSTEDQEATRRYLALLQTAVRARFGVGEQPDSQPAEEQESATATPSARAEMLTLEQKFFGKGHFFVVQSLASVAAEQVQAGDLAQAKTQLETVAQLDIPEFEALRKGHVGWLKTEIALAEQDFDAAIKAAWETAEGYGAPWFVDGAAVLSMAGYALHNAERYTDAMELQQAAAEGYLRCGMLPEALNEAAWLVASQRLAERWNDADHTVNQAMFLADALSAEDYHGILWLEQAWIAEAQGDATKMKEAYENSLAAFQKLGQTEDVLNVLQYMAESLTAIVDNKQAMEAYDRLVRAALGAQQHERAADAAVAVAARKRRLTDLETQITTLQAYRQQMRDAQSIRIVIDEIARLKAGMTQQFAALRRQSREIAQRVAAGEELEKVMAELDAEIERSTEAPDPVEEGQAFLEIAKDHLAHQRFGLASESFFNAARWFNDSEASGEAIHFAMRERGHALLRAHQYEDASIAYRIAADHAQDNSHTRWSDRYRQALSLLAAHRMDEALARAESLLAPESLQQLLQDRGLLGREAQVQAEWVLSDALWKQGQFEAANAQSLEMMQRLREWLDPFTDPLPKDAEVPAAQLVRRGDLLRFRSLQQNYLDTRDRLCLGTFDEDTMLSRYPARLVVVAVREGLFRDEAEGVRLLNRVAEQPTAPESLKSVARQSAQYLKRRAYPLGTADESDPAGTEPLLRARELRRQEHFATSYAAAMRAIEAQQQLAKDQQAALLRLEAELLACEGLVRGPDAEAARSVEEAREHLGQAEALLAATGRRPDDLARCGALRHLVGSVAGGGAPAWAQPGPAWEWLTDYARDISPKAPPEPSLVALANEQFLEQVLGDRYFEDDDVRQSFGLPAEVRDTVCVAFTPGPQRQNLSLIASAPEALDGGSRFVSRSLCLALLDRTAGEQVGPYYQSFTAGAPENRLAYRLHRDALRALLRKDRQWVMRTSSFPPPPDGAVLWIEGSSQPPAETPSPEVQTLVVRKLPGNEQITFGVADDEPQAWQALLNWAKGILPEKEHQRLLEQVRRSLVLLPAADDEKLQPVKLTAAGRDSLGKLVARALELTEPKPAQQ